jgi:hypothetical protein
MVRLLVAAFSGILVFLIGIPLIRGADEPFPYAVVTMFMGFVGAPSLVLWFWHKRSASEELAHLGRLKSLEIQVTDARQISETEDEGLHFFLETEKGGAIFVSGQCLYDAVKLHRFPSRKMRIMFDSKTMEVIQVDCTGPSILVPAALDEFTQSEHERNLVPENLTVFPMRIAEVLKGMGRAA